MEVKKRSPLLWVGIVAVGACALCSLGTLGVVALGALGDDPAPQASQPAEGGEWIAAGEIARTTGLTQPLHGGRWLAQSGSQLDSVKARFADSALVETSSSGTLHELRFDADGSYQWHWVSSSNFQRQSRSSTDERGTWSLHGTVLTLTPEAQRARYTAGDQAQDKEDVDLRPRTYQVVDITLETVPNTGSPMRRFPGIELSGPRAAWDIIQGNLSLDLQRW